MLKYLIDAILNSSFRFTNYRNILETMPLDNRCIHEYSYDKKNSLVKIIDQFCKNNKNNDFIVSLSGGIDSMVLISIIKNLGYTVIGVHINYNNRAETQMEQDFLVQWCNFNNIKLYIKIIYDLKRKNSKRSDYESITKKMRFDFYKEIMKKENIDMIMMGHHKDDIVENIFANVCRGRYILDLAVIKKESIVENVNIARPMIDFYKIAIYDFAKQYQVPYFKDTTPLWSVRGKYRNEIYPRIEDAFSANIKENLVGLSKQSYEWNSLVQEQIIKPFMDNITFFQDGATFNIDKYNNYPLCFWNVIFMNIFYHFDKSCPSRKGIQNFMNCINKENIHLCNISISKLCICSLKKNIVSIEFKL